MTARELALLFIKQMREHNQHIPADPAEPNAVSVWEALICNEPERAWPVFHEALNHISDDEMFEQVWYRLRLLLYRHYDAFRDRTAELLAGFRRFALVAGPRALDAERYREKTFDRDALIDAYRAIHRTHSASRAVDRLAQTDPERALVIATEIIHRGVAKGWEIFDLMSPLQDVLAKNGHKVIEQVEELAKVSVAVRRTLWRLRRHMRSWPIPDPEDVLQQAAPGVDSGLHARLERAAGSTTDYTEQDVDVAPPVRQLDADEEIIEAWFVHEANFWSFSALDDLCDEDPQLAWSITIELIDRADDEDEIGAIAAGPLEDLVRKHADAIWADLSQRAHTDRRFLDALRGVWIFEDDGDVYFRFRDLIDTAGAEPN